MSTKDLNRYIKEYLKRQPRTLSMSQMEELIEYDAWLDEQRGTTTLALDAANAAPAEADTSPDIVTVVEFDTQPRK